jgi:hypothetical protein
MVRTLGSSTANAKLRYLFAARNDNAFAVEFLVNNGRMMVDIIHRFVKLSLVFG